MITLRQIEDDDGVLSLEDDDGDWFLMHAYTDGPRVTIPVTPMKLEVMALAARNRTPIVDERQNVIEFRRRA